MIGVLIGVGVAILVAVLAGAFLFFRRLLDQLDKWGQS